MKINPYLRLKQHGVKGSVPQHFSSHKIYDKAGQSVVLYCGMLEPGAYDYGFHVITKEKTELKKLPGVGSGWFRTETEALLYGAYAVKTAFEGRIDPMAISFLNSFIHSINNPGLL